MEKVIIKYEYMNTWKSETANSHSQTSLVKYSTSKVNKEACKHIKFINIQYLLIYNAYITIENEIDIQIDIENNENWNCWIFRWKTKWKGVTCRRVYVPLGSFGWMLSSEQIRYVIISWNPNSYAHFLSVFSWDSVFEKLLPCDLGSGFLLF